MPPETKRSRPRTGDRPAPAALTRTHASVPPAPDIARIITAAEAIEARALADHRIWSEGFAFGHACGRAEGACEGEAAADWRWMAALGIARRHAEMPTHDELQRRRADTDRPCQRSCGRCSLCIRAAAVRRNGGDRPGGAL